MGIVLGPGVEDGMNIVVCCGVGAIGEGFGVSEVDRLEYGEGV